MQVISAPVDLELVACSKTYALLSSVFFCFFSLAVRAAGVAQLAQGQGQIFMARRGLDGGAPGTLGNRARRRSEAASRQVHVIRWHQNTNIVVRLVCCTACYYLFTCKWNTQLDRSRLYRAQSRKREHKAMSSPLQMLSNLGIFPLGLSFELPASRWPATDDPGGRAFLYPAPAPSILCNQPPT